MSISKAFAIFFIAITCYGSVSCQLVGYRSRGKHGRLEAKINEAIVQVKEQMVRYFETLNDRNSILQSDRFTAKVNPSTLETYFRVADHDIRTEHEFFSGCQEQVSAHKNLVDSSIKSAISCANERPAFISADTRVYNQLISEYKGYISESSKCLNGVTWNFYGNLKVVKCIHNVEVKFDTNKKSIPDGHILASEQHPIHNTKSCASSSEKTLDAIRVSQEAVLQCLVEDVRREEKYNLRSENTSTTGKEVTTTPTTEASATPEDVSVTTQEPDNSTRGDESTEKENTTTPAEDNTTQGESTQGETEAVTSQDEETPAPEEDDSVKNGEATTPAGDDAPEDGNAQDETENEGQEEETAALEEDDSGEKGEATTATENVAPRDEYAEYEN